MNQFVYVMQTSLNYIGTRQVDVYGTFETAHKNMVGKASRVERRIRNKDGYQVLVRTVGNSSITLINAETLDTLASFYISQNSVL